MNRESDIVEWLLNNQARVHDILYHINNAKNKLMEMEPIVFHDDIKKEFYEIGIRKIADEITKDLAVPIEFVYNVIEDKKTVLDSLSKGLN